MHDQSRLPSRARDALVAVLACILSHSAVAQLGAPAAAAGSSNTGTPASAMPAVTEPPSLGNPLDRSPFSGSTPAGRPTPGVLPLTISDAIDRGLRYNLGLRLSGLGMQSARAERLRALSDLLPHIAARSTETVQQINLAAFGIPTPAGTSPIIGPFSVFDVRGAASQSILDLHAIQRTRSASEDVHAAGFAERDAREVVVLAVANLYLQALAGKARVAAANAQFTTADQLYRQSLDLKKNGVIAGIDVLRAQVTMQARRQRAVFTANELAKQKLALARAIGLPLGQQFELADQMPDAPVPALTLEQVLADAYQNRPDYLRAQSRLRAAELNRSAASAQRFPQLRFDGDYGDLGRTPGSSHGTFTAQASIRVPLFEGGRIAADEQQADSLFAQRRAELEDMRGRVDADVRAAFLDLNAAAQRVEVARSSVDLAGQQLQQARDRFAAGVAGSLEVTQSEEAVVAANEDLIESTYAYNIAKAMLARAAGVAEKSVKQFLQGR